MFKISSIMKIFYFIIIMSLCPLALVGQEINLLPEPWKVEKKEGVFTLSVSTGIQYPFEMKECVEIFNKYLSERYGFSLKRGSGRNGIRLIVDKKMESETYNLLVETNGVVIRGSESGVFYGLQTLQQLISDDTENKLLIPAVKIEDRPRFR
jgi:hexosaminidase